MSTSQDLYEDLFGTELRTAKPGLFNGGIALTNPTEEGATPIGVIIGKYDGRTSIRDEKNVVTIPKGALDGAICIQDYKKPSATVSISL